MIVHLNRVCLLLKMEELKKLDGDQRNDVNIVYAFVPTRDKAITTILYE